MNARLIFDEKLKDLRNSHKKDKSSSKYADMLAHIKEPILMCARTKPLTMQRLLSYASILNLIPPSSPIKNASANKGCERFRTVGRKKKDLDIDLLLNRLFFLLRVNAYCLR